MNISGPVDAPTKEGSLILTVDTASGHRLSGGGTFDDGENAITKTYVQSKRVETMTFETQEMWEAMVGSTVSGGFELEGLQWRHRGHRRVLLGRDHHPGSGVRDLDRAGDPRGRGAGVRPAAVNHQG